MGIETFWDYSLQKEVFRVSGSKGYTKTTSTDLKLGDFDGTRIEYGIQTFYVQTVGNKGDSYIVFYANDQLISNLYVNGETVDKIPVSEGDGQITVSIPVFYEIEYKIQAKFLANDDCLGSKSRIIELEKEIPTGLTATLSRNNDSTINYTPNTSFSLPIKFESGQTLSGGQTKTVKVYDNDVLKDTLSITVPNNSTVGTASVSFANGLDEGLHTIMCVFEGDEHNFRSELSFDISVGYNIVLDVPEYVINDGDVVIEAHISDYLSNPVEGAFIDITESSGLVIVYDESDGTDAQGSETITFTSSEFSSTVGFDTLFGCRVGINHHNYYITHLMVSQYDTSVVLVTDRDVVSNGYNATLTAQVIGDVKALPVTFSGGDIDTTVMANQNGVAFVYYNGNGERGLTDFTASIQGANDTIQIEDVVQYWNTLDNIAWNVNYKEQTATVSVLNRGYKIETHATSHRGLYIPYITDKSGLETYTSFDIVAKTANLSMPTQYLDNGEYVSDNTDIPINQGDKVHIFSRYDSANSRYFHYIVVNNPQHWAGYAMTYSRSAYNVLAIHVNKNRQYVIINNVKIRKLHEGEEVDL